MESYDPEELTTKVKQEQEETSNLAVETVQWFLDEEHIGELYPRGDAVQEIAEYLGVPVQKASDAISSVVGDIVDPVQQIVTRGDKFVGAINYKVFEDEGAYGYIHFDDRLGQRKRVVCARCVEKETLDENITHATQGEGTSNQDATWQQLLNKVTSHYADAHTQAPEDIEPGASLLDGTTIAGNSAWHQGNDGLGSGLDADTLQGSGPGEIGGGEPIGLNDSDLNTFINNNIDSIVNEPATMSLIGSSKNAMETIVSSSNILSTITNSQTASRQLVNISTSRKEIIETSMSRNAFFDSATSMQEVASNADTMELISANDPYISDLASSNTGMSYTANSPLAMNIIANSQNAMEVIANSSLAMNTIANNRTAMEVVGNSSTAMVEIENNNTANAELNDSNILETSSGMYRLNDNGPYNLTGGESVVLSKSGTVFNDSRFSGYPLTINDNTNADIETGNIVLDLTNEGGNLEGNYEITHINIS